MKLNIILALLVVVLGYITCKNFQKTQPAAEAPPPSGPEVVTKMGATGYAMGNNADTAATVQVYDAPKLTQIPIERAGTPTTSRRAYLATGWWHCSMAVQGNNDKVELNYQQKWLRFRENQTFDILIKGKVVDSGRWGWDDEKKQIYLSCNDPWINNTWQVQEKGFVMIWIGNTDINYTGIQVRVIGSKTEPKWEF